MMAQKIKILARCQKISQPDCKCLQIGKTYRRSKTALQTVITCALPVPEIIEGTPKKVGAGLLSTVNLKFGSTSLVPTTFTLGVN